MVQAYRHKGKRCRRSRENLIAEFDSPDLLIRRLRLSARIVCTEN